MFNLPIDKKLATMQDRQTLQTPMKRNIVRIGCYAWLLPTRLPAKRDCLLKVCMLVKSARTVSREFHLEKHVYIIFS